MDIENLTMRFIEVYQYAVDTGQAMNPNQFAAKIGSERAPVGAIIKRGRNVGLQMLLNVLKAFPEISADWLILNKGEKLRSANVVNMQTNGIQGFTDNDEKIKYLMMVVKRDEEIIDMLKSEIAKLKKELKLAESGKAGLA